MQIDISDLTFSHASGEVVFENFNLSVQSHAVHAVMGPSGCGKTTLLRVVAGLARPVRGRVEFVGDQLHTHRVAMVFQEPRLIPWWSVGRNVAMSAEFRSRGKQWYRKVRDFHTKQVGLSEVAHRMPGELSLGMQTMAGIGRGFAHDADVLLLDEPFVHLDPITRRKMWAEMETHYQLDPRTYLLVTHDPEEAVLLSDRVSIMSASPSQVVDTIEIDLPRPRTVDMLTHPAYRSAIARIWAVLDPRRHT